jgi:iron complex transport system substrate-binding protein
MRAFTYFLALGAAALAVGAADAKSVTDAAGRTVQTPERIDRVFAAGPPAAIVLYTLAPDKLLGWTRQPSPAEEAYLPERYRGLPAHGRLTGRGGDVNLESVVKLAPDLVVDIGSVGATYASLADRVSEQTGVPAILLGGRLDELPATYRLLGDILGERARAEKLAAYIEETLDEVSARIARLPPEERPRVYYARGPLGLETALTGSINIEALDFVRAENVAGETADRSGLATVSMEQVIAWNPEIIVTVEPDFAVRARSDPLWSTVDAVKNGRIYVAPQYPFPWIDFPPSVNRVIGVRWLASVLYPQAFPEPLGEVTREFYALFYQRDLTDEELAALLSP